MGPASHRLLADLRRMVRTGHHSFTGRPIGAALSSRLPRLIAGVTRLLGPAARADLPPALMGDPDAVRSALGRENGAPGHG